MKFKENEEDMQPVDPAAKCSRIIYESRRSKMEKDSEKIKNPCDYGPDSGFVFYED